MPLDDEYEHRVPHRSSKGRRYTDTHAGVNWPALGIVLASMVNFFALVWGAATMNSGLTAVGTAVTEIKVVVQQLTAQVSRLSERQAVLEYKVEDLKDTGVKR